MDTIKINIQEDKVSRFMYRAKLKEEALLEFPNTINKLKSSIKELIERDVLMTLSIHQYQDNIFVYYECIQNEKVPEEIMPEINEYLERWPGLKGFRYWVPLTDIFHYNRPVSVEHWRRKEPVKRRFTNALRLKPEMYSSYIFYHYQLQEERPAIVGDKYGIIGAHEDFLLFYHEEPSIRENPSLYKGKLSTSNTPQNWGELMAPHFKLLDENDTGHAWMELKTIFEM